MGELAVTREELEGILEREAFIAVYGFRLADFGDGRCTLDVPFDERFVRPGGFVSGPVFMAAADVALWLAIMTRLGREEADRTLTIDLKTAFLSGARREPFRCAARVRKWGRIVYGDAECLAHDGRALTHHTVTYARTRPPGGRDSR